MSEKESFWFPILVKLFGILVAIIGSILLYFTFTSTSTLGVFTSLFGFLGIVILILGLLMILIKEKE